MKGRLWLEIVFIAAFMILACGTSTFAQVNYVGLKYESDELPDELESIGGWVVAETDEALFESLFGVNEIRPRRRNSDDPPMLWFEKTIRKSTPDNKFTLIEVLDVLNFPIIKKNEIYLRGRCFIKNKFDPQVFAIAVFHDGEYLTKILKAWRANVSTGKFESIAINGIKCENPDHGV